MWVESGKPRGGPIFDARNEAKKKYRNHIKDSKKLAKNNISSLLQDKLCCKNKVEFWKNWKNKFNKKNNNTTMDGLPNNVSIADHLADTFEKICQPHTKTRDQFFHNSYTQKILDYDSPLLDNTFDINIISLAINNIKTGKSPGFDGITIEFFHHAHPSVILFMKYLFDFILLAGVVPDDFGKGLTVPIPKDKKKFNNISKDDYRPITVNPIVSKIFECCLLGKMGDYLDTDVRQFGFKKGIGCNKAIYSVKSTTQSFTKADSTVNLGCLDLSKAFDKVNHHGLLLKLMERKTPTLIVKLLENWFSKSSSQVWSNNELSSRRDLRCGLRQGGVLSPFLFSVYVDDLLKKLAESKLGCFINNICMNSFMYADDIILLTISINDMQKLVDICSKCLHELDLPINMSKCSFIRVGARCKCICVNIKCKDVDFAWVDQIRYLGVFIVNAKKFTCSYSNARKKFFGAFNAIYGRIGNLNTSTLLISLLSTNCTPILLYGTDVTEIDKNELKYMNFTYDRVFMKIFGTFNRKIIANCQLYSVGLDFTHLIDLRRLNFLENILNDTLFNFGDPHEELSVLMTKYDIEPGDSISIATNKIFLHFFNYVQSIQ